MRLSLPPGTAVQNIDVADWTHSTEVNEERGTSITIYYDGRGRERCKEKIQNKIDGRYVEQSYIETSSPRYTLTKKWKMENDGHQFLLQERRYNQNGFLEGVCKTLGEDGRLYKEYYKNGCPTNRLAWWFQKNQQDIKSFRFGKAVQSLLHSENEEFVYPKVLTMMRELPDILHKGIEELVENWKNGKVVIRKYKMD